MNLYDIIHEMFILSINIYTGSVYVLSIFYANCFSLETLVTSTSNVRQICL